MRGKTVVITGGFGILGRAASAEAKAQGASVGALDLRVPEGETGLAIALDITDAKAAADAMARIKAETGRIDALFNIAGGFAWEQVADGQIATWERMFALNVKTALTASRAALPHLIETGGAIVNVGSASALKASAGMGPYAASKEGVHKLTEAMAAELKGKVRVNAVLPSVLDTPQNRKEMPKTDPALWVEPANLAKVMLFLASDDAREITGALLPVTGRV